MMNIGVYLNIFWLNKYMSQWLKLDSIGLEGWQFQEEHRATGSRLLQCGSMQLAAFTYTFLFSSLCGGDLSFAVCSAVDCQPETEKVLNATIAVSNNHFAVSKNMNSGSVRGLVLKSTPIQPKDPTDEEVAWNVSVETALSAGGGGGVTPSEFSGGAWDPWEPKMIWALLMVYHITSYYIILHHITSYHIILPA